MPMDSAPQNRSKSDAGKAISEVVLTTIPAVLLYFMGWVYLNFYLSAFGIGISELDIDIQTILIYSFPPIGILVRAFWLTALVVLIILVAIGWIAILRVRKATLQKLKNVYDRLRHASTALHALYIYFIVVIIAVPAVPAIRWAAFDAANQKWASDDLHIDAMIKETENSKSAWVDGYKKCSERHALDLIMADKESYYMLCVSSVDPSSGVVYEVRRDVGLVSVRFVGRQISR
jgi:hypothetical protein